MTERRTWIPFTPPVVALDFGLHTRWYDNPPKCNETPACRARGRASTMIRPRKAQGAETVMTTRNIQRRELQDLARLADTMPRQRATTAPVPAQPAQPARDVAAPPRPPRPELARPPTPSRISVTIPPAVASLAPPGSALASRSNAPRTSSRAGRGALIGVAVAGLVVAIAGGGVLGRTLAHRSAPAAAAVAPPPAMALPARTTVAAAAASPVTAAVVTPPSATQSTGVTASPAAVTAPAAPRAAAVGPRRPATRSTAAIAAALKPAAAPPPAKDSLEEAIRRAVAAPTK